jgi:hypothetical protein
MSDIHQTPYSVTGRQLVDQVEADIATHSTDTTGVHGVADTGKLVQSSVAGLRVEPITLSGIAALEAANQDDPNTIYAVVGLDYLINDSYERTVSGGWGTPDVGTAWSLLTGSTSDVSVADAGAGDGYGQLTFTAGNQDKQLTNSTNVGKVVEAYTEWAWMTIPAGSSMILQQILRWQDNNNLYRAVTVLAPAATMTLELSGIVSSAANVLSGAAATTAISTYTAGDVVCLRTQLINGSTSGTKMQSRLWRKADAEPTTWLRSSDNNSQGPQVSAGSSLFGRASGASGATLTNPPISARVYAHYLANI